MGNCFSYLPTVLNVRLAGRFRFDTVVNEQGPPYVIRIAVVDDDLVLLDLMKEILSERDWDVLPCWRACSAFEELKREMPHAIVLDIRLSGTERGWEILYLLKADSATRSIPVIVWTTDGGRLQEKQPWLDEHHIATLTKPFTIDKLFQTLDMALSHGHVSAREKVTA